MTNSREVEIVARWALALSVASIGLSGCTSEARTQAAPPATQATGIGSQPAAIGRNRFLGWARSDSTSMMSLT